ncbi:PREDICTED: BAI1-associated protein 3 isoform X2 [Nicrophorus vespilloides]|uniref:BAI1-associated protein 3 isoform X2 n=1 Tax=Nicrophorus vespilloides TaxID=110193 RepID=A0ABM1MWV9_NICVS|nr:PREDICTED: BAI1-associated protein 3 isoform X2 [Nicrophorus vespilloides]
MSFFSSLQEYVSNSVAGLSLSPKRQEPDTGATTPSSVRSASGDSNTPGFPKVLPAPGASALVQNRRRTLECLAPAPPIRRAGSFRQRTPKTTPDRSTQSFCCRRQSWPEVDQQINSGVQEIDGSYFESFTALAWKQENRRQSLLKDNENSVPEPTKESNLGIVPMDFSLSQSEKEKLYIEMLYTIANAVGAPAPGGQYGHFKEDLYLYGQRAFTIPPDRHYRMLHLAGEEKPPIVVLSVVIMEAEGLEAKDANGFSDPYCMLGIQPVDAPSSPQPQQQSLPPSMPGRTLSDGCSDGGSPQMLGNHEKLRKHHSFKLSFKRKDGRMREQRDSIGSALPAKFIRATSVKPHTLNPRWNEKFRFDIDDINSDSLHLDIWDHDDESSVLEAVSKLNEVRGVRGLGRFFKQVCQSARQSSQDDFLGCVTIPLQDIPSTGLEGWFKLEARSQRSSVQGRIRLKMWLSTREDRGISEEDNWTELMQHENLYATFIDYELRNWHKEPWTWSGDLPGPALTILHQHAVQGDLSNLQTAIARFVAASRVYLKTSLDPKWMLQLLTDVELAWSSSSLTREEEMWLAEAFTSILERWLHQLRHHRQLFPALHTASLTRLEFVLRCLANLTNMKAFWKCCPFNKEIRGEIVAAIRKGTPEWFGNLKSSIVKVDEYDNAFVEFCAEVYVHLEHGLSHYHPLFEGTNGIPYFSVVFKQLDKLLADEVIAFLDQGDHISVTYTRLIFAVYMEVKDLGSFNQHLPSGGDHKLLLPKCYEWFEPSVSCWLNVCKGKALQRVRASVELQRPCVGEKFVKHSTSAVDVVAMFCQLRDFWRLLQWPKAHSIPLLSQLLDCICSASLLYVDMIYRTLVENAYFERLGPFKLSDEMCISVNNIEYVFKFISLLENYFDFITLESLAPETQSATLTNQLESTLSQLQLRVMDILQRIGPQMQEALRKAMFHLAWSPDTLPTNQAVEPLFDYLHSNLVSLNVSLLPQNFQRVLYEVWEYTLGELNRQMDGGANGEEMPAMFHERLHAALELMVEFFYADGQGLAMESLHSEGFYHVEQRLQYHRTDTDSLIEIFYNQRLQEQLSTINGQYGALAVRAYFNHDSLCVEVLHARDIIPLDPNGFSDPFVIIELLPFRVFPHCNEQQTNVHKKTLHPIFDECFEFSVTLEQCRSTGAMIAFTVMDHDVLTANDFAGEAFLALGNIPGVADTGLGVDNFHGLKPVDLILMQQHQKNQPILQILESRATDRLAMEFVRKQRLRFAKY